VRERESVDPTLINKKKKKKKNRYACKEKTVRERKRFLWFAQREGEREREEYKFWSVSHFGRDELLLSFSLFFLSFFLSSSIHTHFIIKLFGLQVEWVFINLHTYFFVVVLRN